MALSLTGFTADTSITAASLISRVADLEDYINGGIVAGDFQTSSPWLEHFQIVGPRFFGAPARRAEMTSCQIAWEYRDPSALQGAVFTDDDMIETYVPVHGLSRTVNIQPPRAESSIQVIVKAAWYTYEDGANAPAVIANTDYESSVAAYFDLFVDGTQQFDCTRTLYSSTPLEGHIGYKTHSLASTFTLTRGRHDISVRCAVENSGSGSTRNHNRIWTRARALVIRAMYT